MLTTFFVLISSFLFFTVLTAGLGILINKIYNTELDFKKMLQISNAALGVSIMISFMATLVVLQLDINADDKTRYLFLVFILCYFITVIFSLYSHIAFSKKKQ
jgi:hypothetical protein